FETEVLRAEGKVLVDFYADWCGPCKMLSPILEELEKEGSVKVCKINVDEENALAVQYRVSSIPMLVLFENGKATKTTLGYQSKEKLLDFIG
ncbi:MAG: thioredoxin, partial [Clostridia bacterium]|nr:thioredoxin [Clostridia bacterium]